MTQDASMESISFEQPVVMGHAKAQHIDRELPGQAELHIDRAVPFLCVYRARPGAQGDIGDLVMNEASHLLSRGSSVDHAALTHFVLETMYALSPQFGGFLLLEAWLGPPSEDGRPIARIVEQPERAPRATIDHLGDALRAARIGDHNLQVENVVSALPAPPGLPPLLDEATLRRQGCALIGLELSSVPLGGGPPGAIPEIEGHPIRNALRRGLAEFVRERSKGAIERYVSLGPRALDAQVLAIDRALAEIARSFDFVFLVTPVNARAARQEYFSGWEKTPSLLYRPSPIEPDLVKRRLYALPIEDVHDPIVEHLFLEKREEIAGQLSALRSLGSSRFLQHSLLLFRGVEPALLEAAESILRDVPPPEDATGTPLVPAVEIAARARAQLDRYHQEVGAIPGGVAIRDDVVGLSVSRGVVHIADDLELPAHRVDSLLAHEVGTHVVTFVNGSAQRLTLLSAGLVGYDELQEGLAVFAEYIVGGLDPGRLRLLAGRVIGARAVIDGASFVETHRLLVGRGFRKQEAFSITLRLHRGGGLTKDAIYLRGLLFVLDYLERGGDLAALFIGKVGEHHLPIVSALRRHGAPLEPRIMPLHMRGEAAQAAIAASRAGLKPRDLLCKPA